MTKIICWKTSCTHNEVEGSEYICKCEKISLSGHSECNGGRKGFETVCDQYEEEK